MASAGNEQWVDPACGPPVTAQCYSLLKTWQIDMKKSLDYDGNRVSYTEQGNGDAVVLVHGFGETGDVWHNQVKYLEQRFRVIVPDLPGSGDSALTPDMSVEGMADVVNAVIEAAAQKVTLIGHSMGGYITLAFVEKYHNKLNGFGLFHSTAYADSEEKKATRRKGIEFIRAHGAFEFLKTSSPNLFSPHTRSNHPQAVSDFIQRLHNFSGEALVSYYEAMMARPDRTRQLKEAVCPVLFVMGEHDNAVPFGDSLAQSHLPQESHITILHESGHMGMLEEAAKSSRAIEAFLDGN
jgi:pimeloyl-ACP methyl ester carboxylesterase